MTRNNLPPESQAWATSLEERLARLEGGQRTVQDLSRVLDARITAAYNRPQQVNPTSVLVTDTVSQIVPGATSYVVQMDRLVVCPTPGVYSAVVFNGWAYSDNNPDGDAGLLTRVQPIAVAQDPITGVTANFGPKLQGWEAAQPQLNVSGGFVSLVIPTPLTDTTPYTNMVRLNYAFLLNSRSPGINVYLTIYGFVTFL